MRNKYGTKRGESLLSVDQTCYKCGDTNVTIHHIFGGSLRQKSDELGCWVYLCPRCHDLVHRVPKHAKNLKKICQAVFESRYGHDEFMRQFHKSYK